MKIVGSAGSEGQPAFILLELTLAGHHCSASVLCSCLQLFILSINVNVAC